MEKRLEDFDLGFQPSLDPTVIRDLTSLRFLHHAENVVFLGPPGVGKTHLALALGHEAAKQGYTLCLAPQPSPEYLHLFALNEPERHRLVIAVMRKKAFRRWEKGAWPISWTRAASLRTR